MASSSILLSEEQVQCSICLEVFTEPVSTPCGHNFCLACITNYWAARPLRLCYCPMCNERFNTRPELRVNTFIAEMTTELKQARIKLGTVPCDVCTGTKLNAVKSCLVCLASFCEIHLQPHQIAAALKKHKLIHPVENLEDRLCKKHEKPLELFCRDDQMCVCQFCTDHISHKTVPIEEESITRKAQMGQLRSTMQNMIQVRQQKVVEMKCMAENSKGDAETEISESVMVFRALVRASKRSQTELIATIQEKQKAAEKKTEELTKELEREIAELQKRSTELEELSHVEDHLPFLQSSPTSFAFPHTEDLSKFRVDFDLCARPVTSVVSQLEKSLHDEMEKLPINATLRRRKRCAVDVTLDTDTAHPSLVLSGDGKQVRLGERGKGLSKTQGRFDTSTCVLGTQGFSSGRFYYEVEVREKTMWVLGVANESISRNGRIERSPVKGHWALGLWGEGQYIAYAAPDVLLCLQDKPQKVGLFVDYEEGEVTFYDVEARSSIYSFTGCSFTERFYPCFSTGLNCHGENAAPLIICPVIQ